mgnify:CR=1 FL=1
MSNSILFDIECINRGLPPLSGSTFSIVKMIHEMCPDEKRRINRKIRKIAKSEIRRKCNTIRNPRLREQMRIRLKKSANLNREKSKPTLGHLKERINLTRQFINSTFKTSC